MGVIRITDGGTLLIRRADFARQFGRLPDGRDGDIVATIHPDAWLDIADARTIVDRLADEVAGLDRLRDELAVLRHEVVLLAEWGRRTLARAESLPAGRYPTTAEVRAAAGLPIE